jgi:hypothetical protein
MSYPIYRHCSHSTLPFRAGKYPAAPVSCTDLRLRRAQWLGIPHKAHKAWAIPILNWGFVRVYGVHGFLESAEEKIFNMLSNYGSCFLTAICAFVHKNSVPWPDSRTLQSPAQHSLPWVSQIPATPAGNITSRVIKRGLPLEPWSLRES